MLYWRTPTRTENAVRFTAVLRAAARAKVRYDDPPLILASYPTPVGPVTLTFRTRYDQEEFGIPVPRELWVEATGEATTLEAGINASWQAAATMVPVIAMTTNAAIGDLYPHLAFETTAGVEDRAFFQSTVDTERGIPPPGRRVPIESTVATLAALQVVGRDDARDAIRLLRAANQYLLALRYYKTHFELLCVSHVFMAAEALKVVALRRALSERDIGEADLAESWGIRPNESRTRALLEAEARRRIVFRGDEDLHRQAAEISDGFEHGFRDFGGLHGHSRDIRDAAARLVRTSWLDLTGLAEDSRNQLTAGRLEVPVDMTDYVRYVRGRLVGPGNELAPDGHEYPYLEWTSAPKLADAGEGRIAISGEETFTVRANDAIGFQAQSWEFWGPRMDTPSDEDVPTKDGR
jgi:hypothetical protein